MLKLLHFPGQMKHILRESTGLSYNHLQNKTNTKAPANVLVVHSHSHIEIQQKKSFRTKQVKRKC